MEKPDRLGRYPVERELGRGGMGIVYLGRDPGLDRRVAIKVLPPDVADDSDRRERLEREGRMLATLSHPNVATIFGLEETGDQVLLVMEYVEGRTLGEVLGDGSMPREKALSLTAEIAEGLAAAHRAGVVHRDLKPGNVMVDDDGRVKILDLGLAKLTGASWHLEDLEESPTLDYADLTAIGNVVGTATYMSPEQVKGDAVDSRTDVWALGCILYECLAGRPPFRERGTAATLAAILEREPDWSLLPSDTPNRVRDLLALCLRKDPRERLRSADDLCLLLRRARSEPTQDASVVATRSSKRQVMGWRVAALLLLALCLALAVLLFDRTAAGVSSGTARFTIALPGLPLGSRPIAISADGRTIVYRPDDRASIWVREIDDLEARAIPGTERGIDPALSPDGTRLIFLDLQTRNLFVVGVDGSGKRKVVEGEVAIGASWTSNDEVLYTPQKGYSEFAPVMSVSPEGGRPRQLTEDLEATDSPEVWHVFPQGLPEGRGVLFQVGVWNVSPVTWKVAVQSASGEARVLAENATYPMYLDGHLLFYRWESRSLWAAPLDLQTMSLEAEPRPVLDEVGWFGSTGAAQVAISRSGTLLRLLEGNEGEVRLAWVSPDGSEETLLPVDDEHWWSTQVSPDGTDLAVTVFDPHEETSDLWIYDLERDLLSRVTNGANVSDAVWSPDGQRIAFIYWDDSEGAFLHGLKAVTPSGSDEKTLLEPQSRILSGTFSPDGKRFLYSGYARQTAEGELFRDYELWSVPSSGGEPLLLLEAPWQETGPVLSPNGRLLAFTSDRSGAHEIYVRRRDSASSRLGVRVSPSGGLQPHWTSDDRLVYWQPKDRWSGAMMAVDVMEDSATSPLRVDRTVSLFAGEFMAALTADEIPLGTTFSVTPDGRFLMWKVLSRPTSEIEVVLGWEEQLRRRLGGSGTESPSG